MKQLIKLSIAEIVYDIQNKTYLSGRSNEAADGERYETAANMQASDDDDNLYQLHRSINSAIAEIHNEIGDGASYADSDTNNKLFEQLEEHGEYTFSFETPSNFNESILQSLSDAMHRYLVSRAVADWFSITNKAETGTYTEAAKLAMVQIKRAVCQRIRPKRPIQSTPTE